MSASLDFIAIVLDSPAMSQHHHKLQSLGWKIVKGILPVRYDSIAEGFYKGAFLQISLKTSNSRCIFVENLNISGCCGMDELLKLNVFGMTDVSFYLESGE
jgi:hypothetical protein